MVSHETCYLGLCFDEDEEYDVYAEGLTERLVANPDSVVLLNNRGLAFLESGRYVEARADFERACSLITAQEEVVPFQNLAIALMALAELDQAAKFASLVVEAHPNNPSVYHTRSLIYQASGQEHLAAQDLAKSEEIHRASTGRP